MIPGGDSLFSPPGSGVHAASRPEGQTGGGPGLLAPAPAETQVQASSRDPRGAGVGPGVLILLLPPSSLICVPHCCFQLAVGPQRRRSRSSVPGELKAPGSVAVVLALAGGVAKPTFIFCVELSRRTWEQNAPCKCRERGP